MNAIDDDLLLKRDEEKLNESKMKCEDKEDVYRVGRGLRPAAR